MFINIYIYIYISYIKISTKYRNINYLVKPIQDGEGQKALPPVPVFSLQLLQS